MSSAVNEFLATLAQTMSRASVFDAETVRAVANVAAEDIAGKNAGVDAGDLVKHIPAAWLEDPTGATTRRQIDALLAIAGPV